MLSNLLFHNNCTVWGQYYSLLWGAYNSQHYLSWSPCYRIHAVSVVSNNVESLYQRIQKHLDEFKVQTSAKDLVNMIGGYMGERYGKCTEEDLSKWMCIKTHSSGESGWRLHGLDPPCPHVFSLVLPPKIWVHASLASRVISREVCSEAFNNGHPKAEHNKLCSPIAASPFCISRAWAVVF